MSIFIARPAMGDNATTKVPSRSLEHRVFLIFFSPQTEEEHKIMVFLQPSEGKRHNPVYSCGLWVTSRACIWLLQARAAALGDSHESDVWPALAVTPSDLNCHPEGTCSRCCRRWDGQHSNTREGCTHQKSLVLLSELKVVLWLGGISGFLFTEE